MATLGCRARKGTIVDAGIVAARSSTRNAKGERDPEMRRTKKGSQGVGRREENKDRDVAWKTATRPGKRRQPDKDGPEEAAEKRESSVRAKVEHPFLYPKGA